MESVLDVGEELAPLAHEVEPASQQISRGAHRGGVDVSLREHAAAEQHGDLVGVDLVVLGLAAVDRFHRESVTQDEGDVLFRAEIREPVPGERALGGDDEAVAERSDDVEQRFGARLHVAVDEDLACSVEDADVHGGGVKIDAAIVRMLTVVESHGPPPARMCAL